MRSFIIIMVVFLVNAPELPSHTTGASVSQVSWYKLPKLPRPERELREQLFGCAFYSVRSDICFPMVA